MSAQRPEFLGPQEQAAKNPVLTVGDGTEIIDADAPLAAVMSPLSAFLSHASLEAGDNQAQAGQDAIQLMTVHSAKGLEFDAVFITGLEEGLFPHENSEESDDGVEEERRLMYVAITRAPKPPYMLSPHTPTLPGQTRSTLDSRFFAELTENHRTFAPIPHSTLPPFLAGSIHMVTRNQRNTHKVEHQARL